MMARNLINTVAAISVFLLVPAIVPGQQFDLTGTWQDNVGGKYEIRQIGNEVYWVDDGRPPYFNTFHGTIGGNILRGQWVDLHGGRTMNSGTIDLRIESNDRMVKVATTGTRFGGSYIVRGNAATLAQERSRMTTAHDGGSKDANS